MVPDSCQGDLAFLRLIFSTQLASYQDEGRRHNQHSHRGSETRLMAPCRTPQRHSPAAWTVGQQRTLHPGQAEILLRRRGVFSWRYSYYNGMTAARQQSVRARHYTCVNRTTKPQHPVLHFKGQPKPTRPIAGLKIMKGPCLPESSATTMHPSVQSQFINRQIVRDSSTLAMRGRRWNQISFMPFCALMVD